MTEAGPVRVMLVEDHADFRRLVVAWVDQENDMEMVAQAGSLEEARRHLASAGGATWRYLIWASLTASARTLSPNCGSFARPRQS